MDKKKVEDATRSEIVEAEVESAAFAKAQEGWTIAINEKRAEISKIKKNITSMNPNEIMAEMDDATLTPMMGKDNTDPTGMS